MDCLRVVSVAYLCYIVGMDLSLRFHIFSLPFIVTHKGIIMKRTSCPLPHHSCPIISVVIADITVQLTSIYFDTEGHLLYHCID